MKYLFSALFAFIISCGKAQTNATYIKLAHIEASSNYLENISILEKELKNSHSDTNELLQLHVLLINNYFNLLRYEKAIQLCQQQIIVAKKNNQQFNEATLYRYLGNAYYHLKQSDKAILYWKQCLSISKKNNYNELLKNCYHNIGSVILETNQNNSIAESYFIKAIEYGKKLPSTKQSNLANNYRLLATTYDVTGKYKQADSLFALATDIFNLYQDSFGLAEVLVFRARLNLSMNKLHEANKLSKASITVSRAIKNEEYIQTALSIYQRIQVQLGNYKEAYLTQTEILNIEIAKHARNQKKEIAESEAKFKVAELSIKQALAEAQEKQTKKNYITVFLIIFLVVVFLIIFFYQKKISAKEQDLTIKNLRDVFDAEEKERTRIAKDLHDNMGAYATSMLAQIDVLETASFENKDEKLKDLRDDAEYIMSTLRETIWILKTKNLTINQLFDLLKVYTDKHLVKNLNVRVVYIEDITTIKQLSPTISLNLYRIIQEIIQNIIKHAQTNNVEFKLVSNQKIVIEISDNGIGFDYDGLQRKSGLENMEYRANEINYHIDIKSSIGKGTKFKIEEF
jgi:signal transduction histidine kinase